MMIPSESHPVNVNMNIETNINKKLYGNNNYCYNSPLTKPLRKKINRLLEISLLSFIDLAALIISFFTAYYVRLIILPAISPVFPKAFPPNLLSLLWWLPIVVLGCLAYERLYTKRYPFWRDCRSLVKAISLAYIMALAIVTLAKTGSEVSRTLLVMSWFFNLLILPAFRYAGKNALARVGIWERQVLVLGAGETGDLVIKTLSQDRYLGYRVVGILDDNPGKKKKSYLVNNGCSLNVLGGFKDAEKVMNSTGVYNLIVTAPGMQSSDLVSLVNYLQRVSESIMLVPDLFGIPVMGVEADCFFEEKFLTLRLKNNLASWTNNILKRVFDLSVCILVAPLIIPVMVLISLALKLDSPGQVIFSQNRIGRAGQSFKCYKFRTMFIDNEKILDNYLKENNQAKIEWEKYAKIKGIDPRVTKVGGVLRKYSLDELPQLFNVINGNMSLVGPRPYLPREMPRMSCYADTIFYAKPGITGLWQISGRNELGFEERMHLDIWYVRNWSLWLDITCLIRTVSVVLTHNGAY